MSVRSIAKSVITATFVLLAIVVPASDALAQRAFLFVPDIPGDSVVEGYVDWINVLSIRQSATATRKSMACELSVVKNIDVAGPALWSTAATGTTVPEMILTVLRYAVDGGAGGSTNSKLYEIRLTNVRIGAVQATTGAADTSETVALLPQETKLTFYTQSPTGAAGTPVTQSFVCQ